jgi:hypothetical protein
MMKEWLSFRVIGEERDSGASGSHTEESHQEFIKRALRSRSRALETGRYVPATVVLSALETRRMKTGAESDSCTHPNRLRT